MKNPTVSFRFKKDQRSIQGLRSYHKGHQVEQEAGLYLIDQGIRLIAWRSRSLLSEVDWIGIEESPIGFKSSTLVSTLVFFEVRSRATVSLAIESVNRKKFNRIQKHIPFFLKRFPEYRNMPLRIEIIIKNRKGFLRIPHPYWSDAFTDY